MSDTMKTPGVYIQEVNAFPNSVVPVPTSVPVFIGHTEQAVDVNGNDVSNKPVLIESLLEYKNVFGENFPANVFGIQADPSSSDYTTMDGTTYSIVLDSDRYRMPEALRFFFLNGGSNCYVLSIGDFITPFSKTRFRDAIDSIGTEADISLLVIPEAVELEGQDSYDVLSYMIQHCGETMNKFAILDVPEGYEDLFSSPNCIEEFRNKVGAVLPEHNSYAAAYYPWLATSIYQASDVSFRNISAEFYVKLADIIQNELTSGGVPLDDAQTQLLSCFRNNGASDDGNFILEQADATFRTLSQEYKSILDSIKRKLNLIPPSAAMAGIYAVVDSDRGVWKAPANVAVQSVISPAVDITHDMQEDLNVPRGGKSICAIRTFSGMGNLVWGARTLDGNSLDFRYINVRRTLIFVEQSIKNALNSYVFSTNDASTWNSIEMMISNFLDQVWRQGGLVGSKPEEAYSVRVGRGSTMTSDDIMNGILRVHVGVAASHPAEFILITLQQQMQTS